MKCLIRIMVLLATLFVVRGALAQQAGTGPAPGGPGPQISTPSPQTGSVYVPNSSQPQPGSSAHTNYLLRSADGKKPAGVRAPSEGAFGGTLTGPAPGGGAAHHSLPDNSPDHRK
jgi:hypothetical protein